MDIIGYFEEYYINNKFIGNKNCDKKDRVIGFNGKKNFISDFNIVLDNKKIIKKGQEYFTFYFPLNGK